MKWIGCRLLMITVAVLLVLSNPLRAQPDKMVLDSSRFQDKATACSDVPSQHHVEIELPARPPSHL
jgi:hypothetical protein